MNGSRERFSTQVSPDVQARVRATVRGVLIATKSDYSLAQLTEDALAEYCARMESLYNDGKPWRTSENPLRPGRLTR